MIKPKLDSRKREKRPLQIDNRWGRVVLHPPKLDKIQLKKKQSPIKETN
jgi:hypothetical protein